MTAFLLLVLAADKALPPDKLDIVPKPLSSDKSVKIDYPIVYVRAPRFVKGRDGKDRPSAWPEIAHPTNIDAGYDLQLLHPDGKEETLVAAGKGSIADPYVSFDGEWVFYARFYLGEEGTGSDLFKVHAKTKKAVRLTRQESTPNAAALDAKPKPADKRPGKGVFNLGPCPLPGGRLAFTSTRDQVKVPRGYPRVAHQLFTMDDDGKNVEKIGHLNIGSALHPVILRDGRLLFSSLESQGVHGSIAWGIWSIRPDGTGWDPVISALYGSGGADDGFHFQTQLSDESIIAELYYNQNTQGFGTYFKLPPRAPDGVPAFGPAHNPSVVTKEHGWEVPRLFMRGRGTFRMPFQPYGLEVLTRFTHGSDFPAPLSDLKDPRSPRVGKVTHPCGAPDNHLLTVWSSGAMPSANRPRDVKYEPMDAGLYLIKKGATVDEPGRMLLVKNDPKYNEQWPRPLVPYSRIHGVKEPKLLPRLKNDGSLSKHLPAGTPFGLVGTSSLYKRESFPRGKVPPGKVTAEGDPYAVWSHSMSSPYNWGGQGADAGLYENKDIHAVRILAMEPATVPVAGRFYNHAWERLRILGEIPVRKGEPGASAPGGKEPLDPDGNPDTSFLAKIPADVAFTFQAIDKEGMVLNMAQTWHQLRPGEIRNDCGGCHAHSQKPTDFSKTFAARKDYVPFDLTREATLLAEKGTRTVKGVLDVEYHRHVKPILQRSCNACHTGKEPAGKLDLGDERLVEGPRWDLGNAGKVPATYKTLAGQFLGQTKYVKGFQSRCSPLVWKLYGKRLDGLPKEPLKGREREHARILAQGDFAGSIMPPPEAVKSGKVKALTDEDRRTIVRWIDLGCPLDKDFDPKRPEERGKGWMLDDQRPTLALTVEGKRLLVGMHDYGTGLDEGSFKAVADGEDVTKRFEARGGGVWEMALEKPLKGVLAVSVKDRAGNETRIERTFPGRP
ncbi:MAG: hypothetical protein K2W96_25150 [Gemmataceae bacterium]|nr:hypothetical protein [Gemmataceae bacterium]